MFDVNDVTEWLIRNDFGCSVEKSAPPGHPFYGNQYESSGSLAAGNVQSTTRVPKAKLKKHVMFTQSDYNYLSGKGYTDKEIEKIWDDEVKPGSSSVTHKKIPNIVGVVTGH